MSATPETIVPVREPRTPVALALLGFLAFALWLWFTPHAAPVQQVLVAGGGCCCGTGVQNATTPAAIVHGGTAAPAANAPHAPVHMGASPVAPVPVAPPAITTEPMSLGSIEPAGYAFEMVPTAVNGVPVPIIVHTPVARVAEPPVWVLFIAGVLAILIAVWALRRERA